MFEQVELPEEHSPSDETVVEYQILFSFTYQVPVLYFSVSGLPSFGRSPIDEIREVVTPPLLWNQVDNVGVMGAISYSVSAISTRELLR